MLAWVMNLGFAASNAGGVAAPSFAPASRYPWDRRDWVTKWRTITLSTLAVLWI